MNVFQQSFRPASISQDQISKWLEETKEIVVYLYNYDVQEVLLSWKWINLNLEKINKKITLDTYINNIIFNSLTDFKTTSEKDIVWESARKFILATEKNWKYLKDLNELENSNKHLSNVNSSQQDFISRLQTQISEFCAEIKRKNQRIYELEHDSNTIRLKEKILELENEINSLERENKCLKSDLSDFEKKWNKLEKNIEWRTL